MATETLITIKNLQVQEGQKNIITFETRGYLYLKKQAIYLQYEEDGEGLEGVKSTLKIEKDRVTLIRHGTVIMNQIFEKGCRNESSYVTFYGDIPLITDTNNLEMAVSQEEGVIRIHYDLYVAGELNSQNTLEVTYQILA